jgi:hypothetical protein
MRCERQSTEDTVKVPSKLSNLRSKFAKLLGSRDCGEMRRLWFRCERPSDTSSLIVLTLSGGDSESEYRLAVLLSPVHRLAHSSCFYSPKNTY